MRIMRSTLAVITAVSFGACVDATTLSNSATSLTLLFQNNLNQSDDVNHYSALLLDPMQQADASTACQLYSEQTLSSTAVVNNTIDLLPQLSYAAYAGYVDSPQAYWLSDGVALVNATSISILAASAWSGQALPVLCTQSNNFNSPVGFSQQPAVYNITVQSGDIYQGTRSKKAFWFSGVRYAAFPGRFQYSSVYRGNSSVVNAGLFGSACNQFGTGSEDCTFLNIETPYIPRESSAKHLRPVLFFIHGGGFTSGQGGGYGGQLASREDVVTVTVNYRLGTYGFMAVPGYLDGNYGLRDQATALQWVIDNIANFGGDPNHITIAGQSAGAGSVRIMLGSPATIGKFQGAVAMSALGFDTSLGIGSSGYGASYSNYKSVNQSYAIAGQNIFSAANCTQSSLAAQVACLTTYSGDLTAGSFPVARYPVQDGSYINTPQLLVGSKNDNVASVPVIFGVDTDDGGSFTGYSTTCTTELDCLQSNLAISKAYAQQVIDSGLYPFPNTGNVTADSVNVTSRIETDLTFRCVDSATVYAGASNGAFPAAYYYESERGYPEGAYNPNNLNDRGTVSPAFPLGDPDTPYYTLHSSSIPALLATLTMPRALSDIQSIALTSGLFASFIKTGQPNPNTAYLQVRNYTSSLVAIQAEGPWSPVSSSTGPIKLLDYPTRTSNFIDQPQCVFLNASINYLLSATPSGSTKSSISPSSGVPTNSSTPLGRSSNSSVSMKSRILTRSSTLVTVAMTVSLVLNSSITGTRTPQQPASSLVLNSSITGTRTPHQPSSSTRSTATGLRGTASIPSTSTACQGPAHWWSSKCHSGETAGD